jgi:4'-phosphopantetheinyl transferase
MDIFIISTNNIDKVSEETLNEYQKKEISVEEKRKIHCLSYLLVDKFLKEYYGIENTQLVFENGKPMLLDGGKHFSISHSDEMIAIAFSDSNCGVDIEKIRLREFTTISERMGFEANTLGEFYEEWTKYEAVYKLGKETEYGSVAYFDLDDYALTATSEDPCEDFELFMQD